jgi:geranylgeranyl pyrophosphate synthase
VHPVLARYSEALGIAYQIRDDLDDLNPSFALDRLEPSLPLAEAHDRAKGADRTFLDRVWGGPSISSQDVERVRGLIESLGAEKRSRQLLESYKEAAVRSLPELHNASLKGLLRRVIGKIFRVEIQGWCGEFEARNAASGEAVVEAAR